MNPLNLVNKKQVEIGFVRDKSFVARTKKDFGTYKIQISTIHFESGNLKEKFKLGIIKGLKFHEIAHILYKSFDVKFDKNNIKSWLFNLLEDDRVEYKLKKDYPLAASYFNLVLDFLKKDITAQIVNPERNKEERKLERDINKKLYVLYNFIRYDRMEKEDGEIEFLSFVKPLMLSSRRGNVYNCKSIVDVIYRYVLYEAEIAEKRIVGSASQDFDFIEENLQEKEEMLKEIQEKEEEVSKKDKNENDLKGIDRKKAYQNLVVQKDERLVKSLIAVFRNIVNAHGFYQSTEGEINYKRLQEAYIDSFLGEEGYNYLSYKLNKTSFDAIIFRDISGSTSEIKEDYARATINILSAITYFKDNKVALIDFESLVHLRKSFEEKDFSISPNALGTTDLAGALKFASERLTWRNKKKIIIIICDGYPDNKWDVKENLKKDFYKDVQVLSISLLTDEKLFESSVIVKSLEELPIKILSLIGGRKQIK